MQDMDIQTFINVLMDQRNNALNRLAEVTANNFSLQKQVEELKEVKEDSD
mgnify:CR=1 FL=1